MQLDRTSIREVLDGRRGPYADPRVATDCLDDVAVLVGELDDEQRFELGSVLADLSGDDDAVIATAAVLAISQLGGAVDRAALVARVGSPGPALDRSPVGFAAASLPTLRAELALRSAQAMRAGDELLVEELVATSPGAVGPATIAAAVAPALPDLVVARSVEWLDAESAGRSGVLARLPTHWHRVAVAGALRPWPAWSVEAIRSAAAWQHWDGLDTEALVRVMADEAPELTAPEGYGHDERRWWVVAGAPWDWTVWQADDGAVALEVLRSGWSATCAVALLDEAEQRAWRLRGIDALSDRVAALRDR